ncbi:MAG TPA: UDP-N-acetylmuramoyl-L-alanine--D-glutamate ligase [Candidatus Baltobacteraceae bacterium]|jgi:UDP-N-acetylmuramoylalanine--D-glutamate ligase|nr:UDP-N-acetylmuramoyl-L-alanine--D-glutamate ligase [Candidatus Baltobacteraceae bacterium]
MTFAFDANETVLVIGLGKSGLASTNVLRARGVRVFATDEKPRDELQDAIAVVETAGATFVAPGELQSILRGLNSAVLSPGVPPTSPVVRTVNAANVPVLSEIEVAYRLCKAPIVAVTGTKGKSTTTALIGHLLRECGRTVFVGGNIGNPLINEVLPATEKDWVVAEVSSFQLEAIRSFRPRVAVLLNLAPDHLDRYYSMDEYAEAKYRIFANQSMSDVFVGNLDDPRIAQLHWRHGEARVQAHQMWFTLAEHPSDLGAGSATMYFRDGVVTYAPVAGDPRPVAIVRRDEISLAGDHNVQNVMAAFLAAIAAGCDPAALRDAVATFRPMPHRLQTIGEVGGVTYVDDSKSTNPGSVVAALLAFDKPIVLIAGGRSKGTSFEEMGRTIRAKVKALVAIGEAAPEIVEASQAPVTVRAATMDDAVRRARDFAEPGDVVLLSPGCASFDMFRSAEDRGERFIAAVSELREPAGA